MPVIRRMVDWNSGWKFSRRSSARGGRIYIYREREREREIERWRHGESLFNSSPSAFDAKLRHDDALAGEGHVSE